MMMSVVKTAVSRAKKEEAVVMNRKSMELQTLVAELGSAQVDGGQEHEISSITCDSRMVEPGSLFVAIQGRETDGNRFAGEASSRGASAILSQQTRTTGTEASTWIQVREDRRGMAQAAAAFYGHPDRELSVVGITGTNGKTTTGFLLESILTAAERAAGLIGTVCVRWPGFHQPAANTTPESIDVFRYLREMADAGCGDVVLEVSSHALSLLRVEGVRLRVGIFTNLSQDHLDFHGDMDAYFNAKATLFEGLGTDATAVLNADDPRCRELRDRTSASVLTFGTGVDADIHVIEATYERSSTRARLATPQGSLEVTCKLPGRRNLENVMAALGAGLALSIDREALVAGVESLAGVPGRFERIDCGQPFEVIVDFAHTDDALRKLLETVRDLRPARIITLFGCGGERDRAKRPLMGAAAAAGSDIVVLSSDNPRREDPEIIADGAQEGIDAARKSAGDNLEVHRILDRREAIRFAIGLAQPGDAVVIAGKGHESTQIIKSRSLPFDDREEARAALGERFGGGARA